MRVAHDAERHLDARRRHGGDHHLGTEPRGDVLVARHGASSASASVQRDPAHVRLVLDAGRGRLHRDRPPELVRRRATASADRARPPACAITGCRSRPAARSPSSSSTLRALAEACSPPVADVVGDRRRRHRAAGGRRRSRYASRCSQRRQSRRGPFEHRDAARRAGSAASSFATALARFDRTQNGLVVAANTCARHLRDSRRRTARPAASCRRRTPARRCRGRRAARGSDSRKIRSASIPVPQASSGFAASSPGSSASSIAARVVLRDRARTARRGRRPGRRTTRARRPSRGPMAMPRAASRTRRGLENSSIASAISSSVVTSCTPYASNSASYAPSSPASAPECAVTIDFDRSVRPTFSAITGTSALGGVRQRGPERVAGRARSRAAARAPAWTAGPSAYSM